MPGVMVRVKPSVEEEIRRLSEELGVDPHILRNVALVLGLRVISRYVRGRGGIEEILGVKAEPSVYSSKRGGSF